MENAIYDFFQMVWNEFLYPFINSFFGFISDTFNADTNFFKIFFNWLFNIGRETPFDFFANSDYNAGYFSEDLFEMIFLIISIILIFKLIKIIFKPIFKLFNVGGDIKWRR